MESYGSINSPAKAAPVPGQISINGQGIRDSDYGQMPGAAMVSQRPAFNIKVVEYGGVKPSAGAVGVARTYGRNDNAGYGNNHQSSGIHIGLVDQTAYQKDHE